MVVLVVLVVAVTGAALSPPVAGWFAAATLSDWTRSDGTADAELSTTGIELSGTVEGSSAPDGGWVPCEVMAPNSCALGSGTPDSGRSLEDMALMPRRQVTIDFGCHLEWEILSTGEGGRYRDKWGDGE